MTALGWTLTIWAGLILAGIIVSKVGRFLGRRPPRPAGPGYVVKPRPELNTIPKIELQEYLEGQLYWMTELGKDAQLRNLYFKEPVNLKVSYDAAMWALQSVLEKFELDRRA